MLPRYGVKRFKCVDAYQPNRQLYMFVNARVQVRLFSIFDHLWQVLGGPTVQLFMCIQNLNSWKRYAIRRCFVSIIIDRGQIHHASSRSVVYNTLRKHYKICWIRIQWFCMKKTSNRHIPYVIMGSSRYLESTWCINRKSVSCSWSCFPMQNKL